MPSVVERLTREDLRRLLTGTEQNVLVELGKGNREKSIATWLGITVAEVRQLRRSAEKKIEREKDRRLREAEADERKPRSGFVPSRDGRDAEKPLEQRVIRRTAVNGKLLRQYKAKPCLECDHDFQPGGPRSLYCEVCRPGGGPRIEAAPLPPKPEDVPDGEKSLAELAVEALADGRAAGAEPGPAPEPPAERQGPVPGAEVEAYKPVAATALARELQASGLLYRINAAVLHEVGFALGMTLDDDGEVVGLNLHRTSDPEGIYFGPESHARGREKLRKAGYLPPARG